MNPTELVRAAAGRDLFLALAGLSLLWLATTLAALGRVLASWRHGQPPPPVAAAASSGVGAALAWRLSREAATQVVEDRTLRWSRALRALAVISATGPMVGLLAAAHGLVAGLRAYAGCGGGIGDFSAGIAEALVCSAWGALIGIAALCSWAWASSRSDRERSAVGSASLGLP
jgi:hypothetical protein